MRINDFFELSGFQNRIFERSSNKISILTELVDFSEFGDRNIRIWQYYEDVDFEEDNIGMLTL